MNMVDKMDTRKEICYEFDELLTKEVGEFGKRQKLLSFLLVISNGCMAFHVLAAVFIAATPDHQCAVDTEDLTRCTNAQIKAITTPVKEKKNGEVIYSECEMYSHNDSEQFATMFCATTNETEMMRNFSLLGEKRHCDVWEYDTEYYSKTIVNEWDMVCSKSGLASTVAAVFMVGRIIGCLFAGQLADRFGRRLVMLVFLGLFLLSSFACCAMPNYISFIVTRLLMAIFLTASYNTAFIIAVELVGPKYRVIVTCIWHFFWAIFYMLLTGVAYLIRDWRILQAVLTIPDVILFIAWFVLIPESPRWLLVQKRQEEAMKIIRKIAEGNGKTLPENITAVAEETKSSGTYLDLLRTPAIRWISLLLFYNWFSNAFVYYGLALNTSGLGGNPYINFFLSGVVEVPAYAYIWWSYTMFDRLRPFAYSFIAGGVSLLVIMVVPSGMNWLIITFAMLGKLAVAASFGMSWVYSVEVYPTSIRAIGVNMCSSFARFASVPAAYVGILSNISRELPLLIFGAMALLGGVLVFILPETRDQPMRQTVQEGEEFIQENMCQFGLCKRLRRRKRVTEEAVSV